MADTVRSLTALQTLLADNTAGDISPQDVRDFLVSAVYPVSTIVRPGESIQDAFDAGFRHVILADGTHAPTANVTVPVSGWLEGEWQGVILDMGAFRIINNGRFEAATVKNGTNTTSTVQTAGLTEFIIFDNCVRSVSMVTQGKVRVCRFQNFAGSAAASDAYCMSTSVVANVWLVEGCYFNAGPAFRLTRGIENTIRNCTIQMPTSPTVAGIEVAGSAGLLQGLLIEGCIYIADTGSAGANGGHINIASTAEGVAVRGGFVIQSGTPTVAPPFIVRTASDGTIASGLQSAPGVGLGAIDGVILDGASRCTVSNLNLRGEGVGVGVKLAGTAEDRNIISQNTLTNFDTGVEIPSFACNFNILALNQLGGNVSAAFVDAGFATQKANNVTS